MVMIDVSDCVWKRTVYSLPMSYMAHDKWIGEYYVGSDGAMLTGTVTPDGYFVDSSGKWLPWLKDGTYVSIKGMTFYDFHLQR